MLLIEHWYPRKYSVTCTFTILPVMARRTMLLRQACSLPPCRHTWRWLPDSPTSPRRDNPTVWNSHCKQRCVIPPFAEPHHFQFATIPRGVPGSSVRRANSTTPGSCTLPERADTGSRRPKEISVAARIPPCMGTTGAPLSIRRHVLATTHRNRRGRSDPILAAGCADPRTGSTYQWAPGELPSGCPNDMNASGWKLHRLTRELANHWAITVNGNWRLTFSFEGQDVVLVDYQD